MRHAPPYRRACPRGGVPSAVADRDVKRAFQYDEMLFLIIVNVQRNAAVGIGHDLNDRIGSHGLSRGHANPEALARRDLQPLGLVMFAGRANLGWLRSRHAESPQDHPASGLPAWRSLFAREGLHLLRG